MLLLVVGQVHAAVGLEDRGIDVDEVQARHVVRGRLFEEHEATGLAQRFDCYIGVLQQFLHEKIPVLGAQFLAPTDFLAVLECLGAVN